MTTANPQQSEIVDESQTTESQDSEYGFLSFNLHIDTVENKDSVIVGYNVNQADTTMKYKNIQAAAEPQGDAAYVLLQPIFMQLYLIKAMSDEEVIDKATTDSGAMHITTSI